MGSMSWRWLACEQRSCKAIVFASSLNPVSADDYRYTVRSSQSIVAGFRTSYTRMSQTRCDILISAHPDNAGLARYNDRHGACRAYVERSRKALDERIDSERADRSARLAGSPQGAKSSSGRGLARTRDAFARPCRACQQLRLL
jgi:metallo-beta-lactamase class B